MVKLNVYPILGLLLFLLIRTDLGFSQKKWDGGAGTRAWLDSANWFPDGIPTNTDLVILDNSQLSVIYQVDLPPGNTPIELNAIHIRPDSDKQIILHLPSLNQAVPALRLVNPTEGIIIDSNAIFINASGAPSGTILQLTGKLRINNGGKYIHRTGRANADITGRLSQEKGTETGVFEFDVPGTAGYTVSLSGKTFGSLKFRADSAKGAKSYSASGSSPCIVRGDFVVDTGASLSSTITGQLSIARNLHISGKLSLQPATAGSTGRNLLLSGNPAELSGQGMLIFNTNFREIFIPPDAALKLNRSVQLPFANNLVNCQGTLDMAKNILSGPGRLNLAENATLILGGDSAIHSTNGGNIRTASISTHPNIRLIFNADQHQYAGDRLPDTVGQLRIDNPGGLSIGKATWIKDSLILNNGACYFMAPSSSIPAGGIRSQKSNSFISGVITFRFSDTNWRQLPIGTDQSIYPLRVRSTDTNGKKLMINFQHESPATLALPDQYVPDTAGFWSMQSDPPDAPWLFGLPTSSLSNPDSIILVLKEGKWLRTGFFPEMESEQGWLMASTPLSNINAITKARNLNPILNVRWLSHQIRQEENSVRLSWKSEESGEQTEYQIEKSNNGRDFIDQTTIISEKKGISDHFWKDTNPYEPISYYRVRITNGHISQYSPILRQQITISKPRLFPNPVKDRIQIFFPWKSSRTNISLVYISTGAVLKTFTCSGGNLSWDIPDLPNGYFLLKIEHMGRTFVLPFSKS